jgi:hypothetical protein
MSGKPSSPPELGCSLDVIGLARSAHTDIASTPVQAALNQREKGTVEIFEPFAEGLSGLQGFDYAWLLTWLHRPRDPAEPAPLTQVPFLLRPPGPTAASPCLSRIIGEGGAPRPKGDLFERRSGPPYVVNAHRVLLALMPCRGAGPR